MQIDVHKAKMEIKRLALANWCSQVKWIFKDGNSLVPVWYQSLRNAYKKERMSVALCVHLENAWIDLANIAK